MVYARVCLRIICTFVYMHVCLYIHVYVCYGERVPMCVISTITMAFRRRAQAQMTAGSRK